MEETGKASAEWGRQLPGDLYERWPKDEAGQPEPPVYLCHCKGIDMEAAITDSNDLHAEVKHAMVRAAKQPILVMDSSKFDKVSFVSIAKLKEISIVVTNCRPSQEWMRCFARHGIQCVFPEEK